jgi:glutamate--cysteine ligase
MSTRLESSQTAPVETRDELIAYIAAGCKARSDWRIGTEHEKFSFRTSDNTPLPYDGEAGVRALLEEMAARFGWLPVLENGNIIALSHADGPMGGSISLEPGGQFELSGAPLENVHETCEEVNLHLAQAREVGEALGIAFMGLGFSPKRTLAETPHMPKKRYEIMSGYMPEVGAGGLDMMYRTCTIQVNLDFGDEADMVKKFRVALALQPIATALFANSPFIEGRLNGFLSYRSELWRDTDRNRTGMLPFVFEQGMSFERYVDYALDVPMYFVYRDGKYIDVAGASFRDFLAGKLAALPGELPTLTDWSDHLTTLFPEVRMKRFLEMRGADGGPWRRICALPAFWVGLLYDQSALDAAWDLVKDWSAEERQALRDGVPAQALALAFRGGTVGDIARQAVAIAHDGLVARGRHDSLGQSETQFLTTLTEVAESGHTAADQLIEKFNGKWGGDVEPVFSEYAY